LHPVESGCLYKIAHQPIKMALCKDEGDTSAGTQERRSETSPQAERFVSAAGVAACVTAASRANLNARSRAVFSNTAPPSGNHLK
jgi:hypothetical protein